jgi:hypothetical protein
MLAAMAVAIAVLVEAVDEPFVIVVPFTLTVLIVLLELVENTMVVVGEPEKALEITGVNPAAEAGAVIVTVLPEADAL